MPALRPNGKVQLGTVLPPELLARFRRHVAERGEKITNVVEKLIRQELAGNEKTGGCPPVAVR